MPTSPPKHAPIKRSAKPPKQAMTERRRSAQREYDARRSSSSQRGYGAKWQRARAAYLAEHPLCVECESEGRLTTATEVDHIEAHRGDVVKFWDRDNWQGLCKPHHSRKTGRGE